MSEKFPGGMNGRSGREWIYSLKTQFIAKKTAARPIATKASEIVRMNRTLPGFPWRASSAEICLLMRFDLPLSLPDSRRVITISRDEKAPLARKGGVWGRRSSLNTVKAPRRVGGFEFSWWRDDINE